MILSEKRKILRFLISCLKSGGSAFLNRVCAFLIK